MVGEHGQKPVGVGAADLREERRGQRCHVAIAIDRGAIEAIERVPSPIVELVAGQSHDAQAVVVDDRAFMANLLAHARAEFAQVLVERVERRVGTGPIRPMKLVARAGDEALRCQFRQFLFLAKEHVNRGCLGFVRDVA